MRSVLSSALVAALRMVARLTVASRYISRALYPLIAFRWLLWAGAVATLIMHTGPLSGRSTLVTALVASTSMYTFVWSVRLPGLTTLAERRPLILLADLVVSLLPAWLSGGWSSPFMLYA